MPLRCQSVCLSDRCWARAWPRGFIRKSWCTCWSASCCTSPAISRSTCCEGCCEPTARTRFRSHCRASSTHRRFQLLLRLVGRPDHCVVHPGPHPAWDGTRRSFAHAGHARGARDCRLLLVLPREGFQVWLDFAWRTGDSDAGDAVWNRRALSRSAKFSLGGSLLRTHGIEAVQQGRLEQTTVECQKGLTSWHISAPLQRGC